MNTPKESAPLSGTPHDERAPFVTHPQLATVIDPNNPPWGVPTGILTWVASVVLLIVVGLLFIIPYVAGKQLPPEQLNQFLTTDRKAVFLQILSIIPTHLLTLAVAWAVVTRFGKRPFWKTLGWDWGRNFGFWKSAGLGAVLYLTGLLMLYFVGTIKTSFDQTISSSRSVAYLIAFLAVATAPLVEEVVYRGVLYSALHKKLGAGWAVTGVLLLFTLVHVPQYWPDFGRLGLLAFLSLSLTLVRARTGRLLPCFIIHLVFNGIQSILIIVEPYLPKPLTEDPQVPAALISQVIGALF